VTARYTPPPVLPGVARVTVPPGLLHVCWPLWRDPDPAPPGASPGQLWLRELCRGAGRGAPRRGGEVVFTLPDDLPALHALYDLACAAERWAMHRPPSRPATPNDPADVAHGMLRRAAQLAVDTIQILLPHPLEHRPDPERTP